MKLDKPPFEPIESLWEGFSNEPLDERLHGFLRSMLEQTAVNPGRTVVAGRSYSRPALAHPSKC